MLTVRIVHLASRLAWALVFMVVAMNSLSVTHAALHDGAASIRQIEWIAVVVLCALVLFAATWLIFGLRSCAVCGIGLALMTGQQLWLLGLGLDNGLNLVTGGLCLFLALLVGLLGPSAAPGSAGAGASRAERAWHRRDTGLHRGA